jgi:hypothetical protein
MQRIINESSPGTVNPPVRVKNGTAEYPIHGEYMSRDTIELEIDEPPLRGEGLNDWFYLTALRMARSCVLESEAINKLKELAGTFSHAGEIERQVSCAYNWQNNRETRDVLSSSQPSRPPWPERNDEQIREMVNSCRATIEQIKEASPCREMNGHPLDILKALHGATGNEFLCLASTPKASAKTMTFNEWMDPARVDRRNLASWEMCVPNLMHARTGTTKDGIPNRPRTRENACATDQRRFIVTEIDIRMDDPLCASLGVTPLDICASYVLGCISPNILKMVVMSGGKSLHPWLDITGKTDSEIDEIFRSLTPLGVDWRGALPEQQFRLPNGFRADKQAKQSVIYFNPDTTQL